MPFTSIIQKFGIGRDQFLQYQQLKFLIQNKITLTNTLQPSKISEQLLEVANHLRKLLSKLYSFIATSSPTITLPKGKRKSDLTRWTQIPLLWLPTPMYNSYNIKLSTEPTSLQSKLFKMGLS